MEKNHLQLTVVCLFLNGEGGFCLCFCVVQKGRKMGGFRKYIRKWFMWVKSPFVALILNTYGCVFTGICFEDSLRLFIVAYIEYPES